MDSIPIPVEFRCGKCGEKALLAEGDTLTDDTWATRYGAGARYEDVASVIRKRAPALDRLLWPRCC